MYRMGLGWPRVSWMTGGPKLTHSVYVLLSRSRALDVAGDQQSGGHRDHDGHVACKNGQGRPW